MTAHLNNEFNISNNINKSINNNVNKLDLLYTILQAVTTGYFFTGYTYILAIIFLSKDNVKILNCPSR